MPNLEHKPALMTYAELADILSTLADMVRTGDSFEGFIEYLIPEEETEIHGVHVRARYRTGNSMGQGGLTFIGALT